MYEITKTFEISAMHSLDLPYESKCSRNHGHNYLVTVYCASEDLNSKGMVVDFAVIEEKILDALDHRNLNDVEGLGFIYTPGDGSCIKYPKNTTAERIAYWIYEQIDKCYRVDVQESEGNVATYTDDTFALSYMKG